jgi:hypothetical protein
VELVECARAGRVPGPELQNHIRYCPGCAGRWEDERRLSARFQVMREAAAAWQPSAFRRRQLMLEFERAHQGGVRLWLKWGLIAAAVVLVAVAVTQDWRRPGAKPAAAVPIDFVSDAGAGETGFVDVPYAPPLATGELVTVIRTELEPAALSRMGIDVDAAGSVEIPADILVGEDGFPRGVRVLAEYSELQ